MTSADIEAAVAAAVMGIGEKRERGGPREFCNRGASGMWAPSKIKQAVIM